QAEVIGRERDLSHFERDLIVCLTGLLRDFDRHADMVEENCVRIIFMLNEEGNFLTVHFSGKLRAPESLDGGFALHKIFTVVERSVSEEQFVLTVQLSQH